MAGHYDAIVVGVGGMGSAAAYHLARRGRRVLGLERFTIPNEMGSSHGVSRIIRLAYFEDPSYVPLLRRAYELWRELEGEYGEQILHITGCLHVGAPGTAVYDGCLRSCAEHHLQHQVLGPAELRERFPAFRMPPGTGAIFESEGGFLVPEKCILAHAAGARAAGADLREGETVLGWEVDGDRVRVHTDRGDHEAERLILTAGAWNGRLFPALAPRLEPERQVLAWLGVSRPDLFQPEAFPVFIMEVPEGMYYGFPLFAGGPPGLKLGRMHHRLEPADPDLLDRDGAGREDEEVLRSFARRYLPDGSGPAQAMKVCMFTNTPDENFLIDLAPGEPRVVLGAGFSGHGFKFCSIVGEILADLATEGSTRHQIGLFRADRW
ncbi:MAG TPA: N-methyl-L-tryptophan oxidase [Candidatus Dormibacteraeota bacterium]|nr:N-methyl-L-tryptophan oxidase [Candidatus Dormibacteraeota bacterium]